MADIDPKQRLKLYFEARPIMIETFPKLFSAKGRRKPLALGLFHDLAKTLGPRLTRSKLREFLCVWTRSTLYLRAVAAGTPRHDIKGNPVAKMSEKHQTEAREILIARRKAAARKKHTPSPSRKFVVVTKKSRRLSHV